jgi:endogenous inhibitor of DNA gyrase (YacG/DUF329 family)
MKNKEPKISCPICGEPDTWRSDNDCRPFCSDRCKLIDLGEWASETRVIAADPTDPTGLTDSFELNHPPSDEFNDLSQ